MKRTKPNLKEITIHEQIENINQAIKNKTVTKKELAETQKLIWSASDAEPDPEKEAEARRRVQANAPSPMCRKSTELSHMIRWLERLADGRIKVPEKDRVWFEAIKMKMPNMMIQFHKLGIDIRKVYNTFINPKHPIEEHAPDDHYADDPDIIDITPKPKRTTGLVQEKHFDEFWEMYPEKKGKQPAQKAWKTLCKNKNTRPKWDEIVKGLERYKQADTVKNGYILMPAKWIREQRWTDEIPKPKTKSGQSKIGTRNMECHDKDTMFSTGEIHNV